MGMTRRTVVGVVAAGFLAGCQSDGGDGGTPSPEPGTDEPTPTQGGMTPSPIGSGCDPADVQRPPIVEDSDHPPRGYGTKPQALTQQSVADYLADFETAFAWNRILDNYGPVSSLNIDTTTAWTPEQADQGFLASSRIESRYTTQPNETPTTRTYVASYFVSAEPVYRVETDSEAVDPRSHPDRHLVQCGEDTKQ